MKLSTEQAFGWAQAMAAREWRLMLPVAFAFFALPGLLLDVALPDATRVLLPGAPVDAAAQGRALLAFAATLAVNLVGSLALSALALVPGISVGEAIGRAFRRVPSLAGALLLVAAALLAGALMAALLLGGARAGPAAAQGLLLLLLLIAGGAVWVRLSLLTPLLVEQALGPAAALRRSWRMTAGLFWPILGALAAYLIGGTVVLVALSSAVGATLTLLARAMGVGPVGLVLAAVIFRGLAATISMGFQLVVAGLYRQLAARGS